MSKWLVSALAIAAPPLILLACATERAVNPRQPPSFGGQAPMACDWPGGTPGNPEEEVFGDIVSSSTNWSVSITRDDDEGTDNNQADYLDLNAIVNFLHPCSAGGHANHLAEWGWYGFGFGPQCEDPDAQTANEYERHRTANGQFITEEREPHCVNAGHFTLTIRQADFITFVRPIDFLSYTGIAFGDLSFANEDVTGPGSLDVRVDVKDGTVTAGPPAVIEVSATADRTDPAWTTLPAGVLHIPSNFYARFRASNSPPANGFANDEYLVRYFWNWTVDATDRTGFTNPVSEGRILVRAHQFPQGTRTVLAHLIDPDDRHTPPWDIEATNYGTTVPLTFDVYGPLTATISPSAPTVMVQNPLQFTGGGSNGAGSNTYQWSFGDGGSSTSLNPSHTYQHQAFEEVEFRKTDAYNNTATAKVTINVTDPPPTALTASNVTATSSRIGWTIGNPAATTTVERRVTGTSTWGFGGTASAGIDTLTLSSLASCTTYDVKARHVDTETLAIALLHTPAPGSTACAPINFAVVSCTTQLIGGKTYRVYNVAWTQTEFSSGSRSQIGEASTNNPASATIIQNGQNPFTNATITIPITSGINRYYWVRHTLINGTGPSAWLALPNNPLRGTNPCPAQ